MRTTALVFGGTLVVLVGLGVLTFTAITSQQREVDVLKQQVAIAGAQNTELQETNLSLRAAMQDLEFQNEGLYTALSTTEAARDRAIASWEASEEERLRLGTDLSTSEAARDRAIASWEASEEERLRLSAEEDLLKKTAQVLESQNEELNAILSATEAARVLLVESFAASEEERLRLSAENDSIKQTVGDIATLQEQVRRLKEALAELVEARRALQIRSHTTGLACTGSMEPTFSCLDSVTVLENFLPEDIVVGSIVIFEKDGAPENGRIMHRVVDRKLENGVYFYRTQGDANPEPDGYWVHQDWVIGYVTEIHRGTHPENAELRIMVNEARDAFESAREVYREKVIEFCGSIEAVAVCLTSAAEHAVLSGLYADHIDAYCQHIEVLNLAKRKGGELFVFVPQVCWE